MSQTERITGGHRSARGPVGPQKTVPASTPASATRVIEPVNGSSVPASMEERIRQRAYERYLQRQGRPGSPETDWLEAEREVRSAMWAPSAVR